MSYTNKTPVHHDTQTSALHPAKVLFTDTRASTGHAAQLQNAMNISPRHDQARRLTQLAKGNPNHHAQTAQAKKISVKLNITGSYTGHAQSPTYHPDNREDKGAAGLTIANTVTKTEGQQAVDKTAFGMVTPTHTTTIATAQKTDDNLVVNLSHAHNLDTSFGSSLGINVGTKDAVSAIRKSNWTAAKADLTPNDAGKPPRTQHYSSQYLRDHEANHVVESEAATKRGITEAQTTLGTEHKIDDVTFANTDAMTLAEPIRKKAEEHIRNTDYKDYMGADWGFSIPHADRPGEKRTYAKGKADYQALADKIGEHATRAGWNGQAQHQPHSKKTNDRKQSKK